MSFHICGGAAVPDETLNAGTLEAFAELDSGGSKMTV